jgi:hypothetical protein
MCWMLSPTRPKIGPNCLLDILFAFWGRSVLMRFMLWADKFAKKLFWLVTMSASALVFWVSVLFVVIHQCFLVDVWCVVLNNFHWFVCYIYKHFEIQRYMNVMELYNCEIFPNSFQIIWCSFSSSSSVIDYFSFNFKETGLGHKNFQCIPGSPFCSILSALASLVAALVVPRLSIFVFWQMSQVCLFWSIWLSMSCHQ